MRWLLGAAVILATLAACGEDDTGGLSASSGSSSASSSGAGGAGGMSSSSSSGQAGGGGGGGPVCKGPGYPGAGAEDTLHLFDGHIEDTKGSPAVKILADLCGTNICISAETNASGDVNGNGKGEKIDDAHFIYGNGHDYVKMVMPVTFETNGDVHIGDVNTVRLPAKAMGKPFAAGEAVTMGPATLEVASGAGISHDILLYLDESERGLRAVAFPASGSSFPALDDAPVSFALVVGLAPINTAFCPAAKLTLDNSAGLAANTAVEFWYHGTKTFVDYAPYGGWAKVSDGAVSADGKSISTSDGQGIPELGVIGVVALK